MAMGDFLLKAQQPVYWQRLTSVEGQVFCIEDSTWRELSSGPCLIHVAMNRRDRSLHLAAAEEEKMIVNFAKLTPGVNITVPSSKFMHITFEDDTQCGFGFSDSMELTKLKLCLSSPVPDIYNMPITEELAQLMSPMEAFVPSFTFRPNTYHGRVAFTPRSSLDGAQEIEDHLPIGSSTPKSESSHSAEHFSFTEPHARGMLESLDLNSNRPVTPPLDGVSIDELHPRPAVGVVGAIGTPVKRLARGSMESDEQSSN